MPYPVFPGILCLMGLGMLYIVFGCWWNDRWLIRRWRHVTGTIVRAKLDQSKDVDGSRIYSFEIEYEYSLDGENYRGTRLRTLDQFFNSSSVGAMRQALEELPPGGPVEIVCHPRRPQECMMVRQLTPRRIEVLLSFVGAMILLAGAIWFAFGKQ